MVTAEGDAGKAQVQGKGKGALLGPPATDVGLLVPPVVVQLLVDVGGSAGCFQTTFDGAGVAKQDAENFKAKGP